MTINYPGAMKNMNPIPVLRQDRRSFLRFQAIPGLGTFTAGMVIPVAYASPRQPDFHGF